MSPGKTVAISVCSGILVALANWAGRRFLEQAAVDHLKDFLVTFIPVWSGLVAWAIVWALLSIRRITHGRDDEFTKWRDERRDQFSAWADGLRTDIKADFETRYIRIAGEARYLLDENKGAVDRFNEVLNQRFARLEAEILTLDRKVQNIANHIPGYQE